MLHLVTQVGFNFHLYATSLGHWSDLLFPLRNRSPLEQNSPHPSYPTSTQISSSPTTNVVSPLSSSPLYGSTQETNHHIHLRISRCTATERSSPSEAPAVLMASYRCRTSLRWSSPAEPHAAADSVHVITALKLILAADESSPAPRCPPKLPMSHMRHHRRPPPTSPAPKGRWISFLLYVLRSEKLFWFIALFGCSDLGVVGSLFQKKISVPSPVQAPTFRTKFPQVSHLRSSLT